MTGSRARAAAGAGAPTEAAPDLRKPVKPVLLQAGPHGVVLVVRAVEVPPHHRHLQDHVTPAPVQHRHDVAALAVHLDDVVALHQLVEGVELVPLPGEAASDAHDGEDSPPGYQLDIDAERVVAVHLVKGDAVCGPHL
eukprot:CAMPEP_0179376228 /NCGR_PEP_ID=MMETSP0797-20121207/88210_1 /TAXON_ID=47934 /ORGANISM="Dinophysis acuminata, Strain DAEP01" /LENGTH=137 /DNA_ID=CAMNT_0021092259 /DNA_START=268 /DNA_END=683 /DNA_ORIENTATION=-